jgi:exodeoxyribonuclease V gamma subunit
VLDKQGMPRGEKLLLPWLRQLAASASGAQVRGLLVARDALVTMAPLEQEAARATLGAIVALWRRNLDAPLGLACKTALVHLQGGDARRTYDGGFELDGEVDDPCLARLWPQFALLAAGGDWPHQAEALYGPLAQWLGAQITIDAHPELSA